MARMKEMGLNLAEEQLNKLGRPMIRRIVEAGAAAAEKRMAAQTESAGHAPPGRSRRATGEMLRSIGRGEYREWFGGGAQEVYPQGSDRKGVRNATKAYVLNYGRGRKLRGDKFITGDRDVDEIVRAAMQAESDRLLAEIDG